MEFFCTICNKNYCSYKSLWNHNNQFHKEEQIRKNNRKIRNFECEFCNKKFVTKQSMNLHIDSACKSKNIIIEQNKNNSDNQLKNEVKTLKNEVLTYMKEVEHLKDLIKQSGISPNKITNNNNVTNNNITNNNITNNTINNVVMIKTIGTENIKDLNFKELLEIFDKHLESPIKLAEHLNFNERLPENHNFCSTSLEGKYVQTYNTSLSKHEPRLKKYFFAEIILMFIKYLQELYKDIKNKIPKKKQQQVEDCLEILNTMQNRKPNDKVFNGLIKELIGLSYNRKDIVLDTWENKKKNTKSNSSIPVINNKNLANKKLDYLLIDEFSSDSELSSDEESDTDLSGFVSVKSASKNPDDIDL